MDDIQDHLAHLLGLYRAHASTISTVTSYIHQTRSYIGTQLGPFLSSKPDLVTIFLLLVILFLSLKLLRLLVQTVLWWVRLVIRLAFWGGLILVIGYIWVRGIEGVTKDIGQWGRTWTDEYHYWEARGKEAQRLITGGSDNRYARGSARKARAW